MIRVVCDCNDIFHVCQLKILQKTSESGSDQPRISISTSKIEIQICVNSIRIEMCYKLNINSEIAEIMASQFLRRPMNNSGEMVLLVVGLVMELILCVWMEMIFLL